MSEMIAEIWSTPETNVGATGQVIDDSKVRRLSIDWRGEIPVQDISPPSQDISISRTISIKVADISMLHHRLMVEGIPYKIVFIRPSPKRRQQQSNQSVIKN